MNVATNNLLTQSKSVQYLIDTDISSYIIKHKPTQVKAKFDSLTLNSLAISAITQAELLYGLKKLPENHQLHEQVQRYLLLIPVLDWTANAGAYYADIHHHLRSTGQTIGEMDMMIASHALAINAVLVTNNNKHYQRIVDMDIGLQIENWI